ncbi:MAG: DUF1566 domain-containing protein [Castellaniella sp.]|nr:DUF1566 domain-containing protein [Castellaniella sp.]
MSTITLTLPAPIGAELGGGIYVGPHFQPDGSVRHLVSATESLGDHKWEDAKDKASEYRGGGFNSWFLPSKNDLTVALLNARDKFDKAIHWTSTPYGERHAWAVAFEPGRVSTDSRSLEFRVRPFRVHQFIPSSLSQVEVDQQGHRLAYDTAIDHSGPARAMLDLVTSTGGDSGFDSFEPEQQQAYLRAVYAHVAAADDALRLIGGFKS